MSKFDYDAMQATASRLLDKFGSQTTVRVVTGKTYNPATGSNDKTYTNATGNGVTVNFRNSEIDGDLVRSSDIKLIIENLTTEPVVDSEVTVRGGVYRVMDVMPLNPAGTNLIYTLQLRK